MKIKQTIIHISVHYLIFVGVIFAVAALKTPAPTPPIAGPVPVIEYEHPSASPSPHTRTLAHAQQKSSFSAYGSEATTHSFEQISESIQKEYVYHMLSTPNDPSYTNDWSLAQVNAPGAWSIATGNSQTVVAVIDGGFGLNHEDLVNQWATNSGEMGTTQSGDRCWIGTPTQKQTNNCDDDNNGYVDDWRGWSFVLHDNNPQAGRENSSGSGVRHATEVAGLVGATGNNGTGIVGINWNTKIMPLQALDDNGTGYTSSVTAAVYYAVDNGAQVINLSLGAYANDPALKTAINYATTHGVIAVAAAGNCGDVSIPECTGVAPGSVAYPAAYPDVIAVGASTSTDQVANFSSYGPSIDVVAPGYNIPYSTTWTTTNGTSAYAAHLYGTSFASPMVASLASLIKSIRPNSSIGDITALIDATTTRPTGMNGLFYTQYFGHGVINASAALSVAQSLNSTVATPVLLQAGSYQSEHSASSGNTLSSGCQLISNAPCTVQATDSSGYKRFLPYHLASNTGDTGWSWISDMLDSGDWTLRARSGDTVSNTPYSLFKR